MNYTPDMQVMRGWNVIKFHDVFVCDIVDAFDNVI